MTAADGGDPVDRRARGSNEALGVPAAVEESGPDARQIADALWLWDQMAEAGGRQGGPGPPGARPRGQPPARPRPDRAEPTRLDPPEPVGPDRAQPTRDACRDAEAIRTVSEVDERRSGRRSVPAGVGRAPVPEADALGRGYQPGGPPDKSDQVRYLDEDVEPEPRPAITSQLAMARALRPLEQTVASIHRWAVDETATAEGMLDLAAPFPVLRPATERRWDLVLVVDTSTSMTAAWADAVPGLTAFLERQHAFRDVTIRYLDADVMPGTRADGAARASSAPGNGSTAQLRILRSLTDPAPVAAADLVDHAGRRIIWILTDGLGAAWRSDALASALSAWARQGPVAIVDLLPSHLWRRTPLRAERLRMRSAGRFGVGSGHHWIPLDPLAETGSERHPDAVPVPIVELDPGWVGRWASFVAAPDPAWFDLAAIVVRQESTRWKTGIFAESELYPQPPVAERLRDFLAGSSPTVQRFASALAAAPITKGSLRLVADMADVARPQISELFSYGLLRAANGRPVGRLEFVPEAREYLLGLSVRSEQNRTQRAVAAYLMRIYGDTPEDHNYIEGGTSLAPEPGREAPGRTARAAPTDDRLVTTTASGEMPSATEGQPTPGPSATESADDVTVGGRVTNGMSASPPSTSSTPQGEQPDEAVVVGGDSVGPAAVAPGLSTSQPTPPGLQSPVVSPAHAGRLPAVWGNVPPKNPYFTGRQGMLERIEARLRAERTTTVVPEAVHGMGGVGKTQLAIEFVYRHLADYDVIWWIPAERTVQIGNALSELGERLGLAVGTEANVAIREVLEALRVGRPYSRWLLVFDNAEDPKAVREFFPQGTEGQILVTSRNSSWANVTHSLEVTVFQREESIALLRSRGGPLSGDDANLVADALGDLPLAVEQAATWRAETGMSAGEYVRLLDDKKSELLGTAPMDYELPVTAAWNVSLDRLQESNPAALELLQTCAFFAPEPISRNLLSRGYNETISPALDGALRDPVKLGQAIRAVNRYALARIDHRTRSIVMHRLVQAVLVGRMTPEEQEVMRHGAHVLLAANDPNDPQRPAVWSDYADLYPHVIASHAADSAEPRVRRLLVNLVDYLYRWGDHDASATLAENTYRTWVDRFGPDDPNTLDLALQLGWILGNLGRYAQAAEMNRDMLDGFVRVYGADSEQSLQAYGNVISDLRFAGNFEGSLELARRANESAVRVLGPEEPVTLSTAHNVGVTLRLLGRYTEAQHLDEETWRLRSLLFGEDDFRTLNTLSGLIIDRRELGDYLGAQAASEDAYVRYQRVFPQPNNPSRLRAGLNLAVARRKAGRHEQALELSRDVEQRLYNRYGGDLPESMAAGLNLSIDLRHAGLLGEAHETCVRARGRYTRAFGERHPHTLTAGMNLAVILRLMGDSDEAARLNEASLAMLTDQLGPTHPSTLACATNLASDLYAQGRFQEAHDRDVRIREQLSTVQGEVHPSTLAVAANLAMDLRALDRKDEALRLQADTLRLLDAVLGEDHRFTRQAAAWVRSDCDVDPMPL